MVRNVHPSVMLLRTETYWLAGGVDEDFVGAYGYDDTDFLWRANQTGSICLPDVNTIRMRLQPIKPMHQVNLHYECPLPPKTSRNEQLIIAKTTGRVARSNEYLRFTWHVASASTFNGTDT